MRIARRSSRCQPAAMSSLGALDAIDVVDGRNPLAPLNPWEVIVGIYRGLSMPGVSEIMQDPSTVIRCPFLGLVFRTDGPCSLLPVF